MGRIWRVGNSPLKISFIHTYVLISYYILGNIPSVSNTAEKSGQKPFMQLIFWWGGEHPFYKLVMTRKVRCEVYMYLQDREGFFFFSFCHSLESWRFSFTMTSRTSLGFGRFALPTRSFLSQSLPFPFLLPSCHMHWGMQLMTMTNHQRFLLTSSSVTILMGAFRYSQPEPHAMYRLKTQAEFVSYMLQMQASLRTQNKSSLPQVSGGCPHSSSQTCA